ncbi:KH domain-containing protein [Corynebacterium kroppenstedtii]|uniref:KH domain-containing protein n=1 Tax=Corynebacterium sp. PCR 32 TaxID=3351342 RepID=UPI0030A67227
MTNPFPSDLRSTTSQAMSSEEKIVLHLVQGIVAHPDDVAVQTMYRGRKMVLVVSVHPDDRALVIGRKGRHAEALRTVLHTLDSDVRIEIR